MLEPPVTLPGGQRLRDDTFPVISYYRHVVHRARAPFHDHVGELGDFYLRVVALFHQVHDGQGGALGHRAPALAVAVVAFGLLAAAGAPEGLIPGRLDDPVLGPREGAEVDEVLLSAAGVFALADVAVATRAEEKNKKTGRLGVFVGKQRFLKFLATPLLAIQ